MCLSDNDAVTLRAGGRADLGGGLKNLGAVVSKQRFVRGDNVSACVNRIENERSRWLDAPHQFNDDVSLANERRGISRYEVRGDVRRPFGFRVSNGYANQLNSGPNSRGKLVALDDLFAKHAATYKLDAIDKSLRDAMSYNGKLYVGGLFTQLGDGTAATNIAAWDSGTRTWTTLSAGSGWPVAPVYALTAWNGLLYATGNFAQISTGLLVNKVATFDGTAWSALPVRGSATAVGLGSGATYGRSLAVTGGLLYVGGGFGALADGTGAANMAVWNGSALSSVAFGPYTGTNGDVRAMAEVNGTLHFGGQFTRYAPTSPLVYFVGRIWPPPAAVAQPSASPTHCRGPAAGRVKPSAKAHTTPAKASTRWMARPTSANRSRCPDTPRRVASEPTSLSASAPHFKVSRVVSWTEPCCPLSATISTTARRFSKTEATLKNSPSKLWTIS